MASNIKLTKVVILPNFNKVVGTADTGEVQMDQGLDFSDLNLEGVHAVEYDPVAGTVEVEYIKPANDKMTVKEFHDYFGKVTGKGRKHVDEAHTYAKELHAKAREERAAEKAAAEKVKT